MWVPNKSLFTVFSCSRRPWSRLCRSQGVCACLAQWLNQSFACAGFNVRSEVSARFARPDVSVGPDEGPVPVIPASSKPWFRKRCPQGVCVCFAQWLNPSLGRVVSACRAKPAIEALSTRGLPRRTRSLTKPKALIGASPFNRAVIMGRRLTPNQPFERTPPRCALPRRSRAC